MLVTMETKEPERTEASRQSQGGSLDLIHVPMEGLSEACTEESRQHTPAELALVGLQSPFVHLQAMREQRHAERSNPSTSSLLKLASETVLEQQCTESSNPSTSYGMDKFYGSIEQGKECGGEEARLTRDSDVEFLCGKLSSYKLSGLTRSRKRGSTETDVDTCDRIGVGPTKGPKVYKSSLPSDTSDLPERDPIRGKILYKIDTHEISLETNVEEKDRMMNETLENISDTNSPRQTQVLQHEVISTTNICLEKEASLRKIFSARNELDERDTSRRNTILQFNKHGNPPDDNEKSQLATKAINKTSDNNAHCRRTSKGSKRNVVLPRQQYSPGMESPPRKKFSSSDKISSVSSLSNLTVDAGPCPSTSKSTTKQSPTAAGPCPSAAEGGPPSNLWVQIARQSIKSKIAATASPGPTPLLWLTREQRPRHALLSTEAFWALEYGTTARETVIPVVKAAASLLLDSQPLSPVEVAAIRNTRLERERIEANRVYSINDERRAREAAIQKIVFNDVVMNNGAPVQSTIADAGPYPSTSRSTTEQRAAAKDDPYLNLWVQIVSEQRKSKFAAGARCPPTLYLLAMEQLPKNILFSTEVCLAVRRGIAAREARIARSKKQPLYAARLAAIERSAREQRADKEAYRTAASLEAVLMFAREREYAARAEFGIAPRVGAILTLSKEREFVARATSEISLEMERGNASRSRHSTVQQTAAASGGSPSRHSTGSGLSINRECCQNLKNEISSIDASSAKAGSSAESSTEQKRT